MKYTYLVINFFSILIPILFSFGKRLSFYKEWKALFPALILTGIFFIVWDHYLTLWNVWHFNPEYITGIYIFDLPVEEWLFFFTIPYACVFIYASLNKLLRQDFFQPVAQKISMLLFAFTTIVALTHLHQLYTSIKLSLTAILLLISLLMKWKFMGKFYRAYFTSLIPFFIVNGLLTALPVVIYNDAENSGVRIFTIPMEDILYTLLLLLMNISLFELFRSKHEIQHA